VAGDEHKGQEGSSPTQRFRFCGDGRTSYVDLIRKLILLSSIDQRSSTISHLIHSPCLAWEMAFTLHPLLLLSHLVDYQLPPLSWPALCHLGGANLSPSSMLYRSHNIPNLIGSLCLYHRFIS